MNSPHIRHNSPFATPEKESPGKKQPIVSPSETFGGKKGFLSLFSKKKAAGGFESERDTKPVELENRRQAKQKIVNRKNIADGRIRLDVIPNDRVPEDFLIDYKDNPFDWLDQNPVRTTSFIENLRSRDFSQINNREVRQFLESQEKKEIAPPSGVQNLEYELLEVSKSFDEFLGKFFRFFQGMWPGFCIISLFLIFAGSSDQDILDSFVLSGIRVYQIFHVIALISALGALNRYIETRSQYQEAARSQPQHKIALGKQKNRYFVAMLCFVVAYGILVYNHEFVAKLSDKSGEVEESYFSNTFSVFRALSAIMAAFAIIGWFVLILAFDEVSKTATDMISYSEMTLDESMEEQVRKV